MKTSPAASRLRKLQLAGASCLAASAVLTIVATLIGGRISWPLWLMLGAAAMQTACSVVRRTRPIVSDSLAVVGVILSVGAVVSIVVSH